MMVEMMINDVDVEKLEVRVDDKYSLPMHARIIYFGFRPIGVLGRLIV